MQTAALRRDAEQWARVRALLRLFANPPTAAYRRLVWEDMERALAVERELEALDRAWQARALGGDIERYADHRRFASVAEDILPHVALRCADAATVRDLCTKLGWI